MLSKSVKNKRRRQAAEAAQILDALWAAVPEGVGVWGTPGRWSTLVGAPCHILNEREGLRCFPLVAREVARFPRGSKNREDAAFYAGTANVVSALGHYTPYHVLLKAGLL
jgi:hypothetical protein